MAANSVRPRVNISTIIGAIYPVGSIYMSVESTNPGTTFGVGTWTAWGSGKVPVGVDVGDASFDTVEETGGAKTVTLDTTMIPSHTHTQNAHTHTQDAHTHTQNAHTHTINDPGHYHAVYVNSGGSGYGPSASTPFRATSVNTSTSATGVTAANATAVNQNATATNQNTTATNQNTGGGLAHNNLQPYITCYMWKRTA
jgi:microcystin-dependent protein